MANQSRRLKRIIKQAVRDFKKSGVTLPPPRKATAAQQKAFKQQMRLRVKQITEQLEIFGQGRHAVWPQAAIGPVGRA